jgi:hypothetical protein
MRGEVKKHLTCLIEHLSTGRYAHNEVSAVSTRSVIPLAGVAVLSVLMLLVAEVDERGDAFVYSEVDVTAAPAVSTVGATTRHIFFTPEADRAVAAMP